MTAAELLTFTGYLVSSWVAGFTAGYLMTQFKNAISQI